VSRAAAHGLQYLVDAGSSGAVAERQWPPAQELFRAIGDDLIQVEQYCDFLRNRMFRRSLLCHADLRLDRSGAPARVADMRIASELRASGDGGPMRVPIQFLHPAGGGVEVNLPLTAAALATLYAARPDFIPFYERLAEAARQGRCSPNASALWDDLYQFWLLDFVELWAEPPRFALKAGERPVACPVARRLARAGHSPTNRRHEIIALAPAQLRLLSLLDGTRSREQLADEIRAQRLSPDGRPLPSPSATTNDAHAWVEECLKFFARASLLIG
jgi:hypothetical protein